MRDHIHKSTADLIQDKPRSMLEKRLPWLQDHVTHYFPGTEKAQEIGGSVKGSLGSGSIIMYGSSCFLGGAHAGHP